jgi:hypothetical protein
MNIDARGLGGLACVLLVGVVAGCKDADEPPGQMEGTGSSGIDLTDSSGASADSDTFKLDMPVSDTGQDPTNAEAEDGCTEVTVMVTPVTPTVVLQVDQSSSMEDDFSGTPRWDALYQTLMEPGGVVDALQSDVRFGLALYSSENGTEGPSCPMLTEVPPALDNHAAIDAVYTAADPIDETPTGESLALVAEGLAMFPEEGPKAIVLATDGEPDTCAEPNPQNGQPEVIAAVQAAYADGIETFVISVGDEVGADHLQEVANAGVGKPVDDPDPAPYYIALNAGQLVDAFGEIIAGFISCQLTIDGIVDLDKQCEGTVLLDGVELECPVDWHMLDESTLELLGGACETLKDGMSHEIDATWPCDAVNIP